MIWVSYRSVNRSKPVSGKHLPGGSQSVAMPAVNALVPYNPQRMTFILLYSWQGKVQKIYFKLYILYNYSYISSPAP